MEVPIQACLRIMKSQESVSMSGQMTKPTRVSGNAIKCTGQASWSGRTANVMKASLSMTKERGEAYSSGKMAGYTRDNGSRASSMELVLLQVKKES